MAMGIKNKYVLGAHLSERKFRELLRLFAADVPALATADLSGLNRNTENRYFRLFRERIAEICERESPFKVRWSLTNHTSEPVACGAGGAEEPLARRSYLGC